MAAEAWYQRAFGAHYPLLYAHRDEAEAERCLRLLPRLAPLTADTGGRILDLGCGDGRHLERLAGFGAPAVGLDLSPELLDIARRRSDDSPLVRADMRRLPFGTGRFTSVLSLFTAFGYFGNLDASGPVVAEVARLLAAGGHWFLDYLDCSLVRRQLQGAPPQRIEREIGPLLVAETKRLSANADRVVKEVEIRPAAGCSQEAARAGVSEDGLRYEEQVALFELDEIDGLAAGCGLQRIAAAGDYDGGRLGAADRWILVFRRNDSTPQGADDGA